MNFQGLEFDGVPADGDIASDNESMSSLVDEDVEDGYVYALFHFPQMVDGQITVEEGEKLTLLDDSNSYWWLVQSLRDNRMGYIPADNIETSEGKKARVYRRRNLKLCQPDPEMVRNADSASKPKSHGRRVNFSDKLVTQVFISSPVTDDEDYDEEYDYDYGDEDTAAAAVVPEASEDRAVAGGDAAAPDDDDDDGDSDDDNNNDNDSDGCSYYYSSAAGDAGGYDDRAGSAASDGAGPAHAGNARRVSIAPTTMSQTAGEVHSGSDSETDSAPVRSRRRTGSAIAGPYAEHRESTVLIRPGEETPTYYLSNDESDDGDSLTGVLGRLSASRESQESGRFTIEILRVGAYGSDSASVSVFEDELFSEVLRRAVAAFGMPPRAEPALALYAKLAGRDLAVLPGDTQTAALVDSLRARAGAEVFPSSGSISPSLCTLVLADKAIPPSQLALHINSADEGPYVAADTGSRNILRTSVAASISEGITSLAASASVHAMDAATDDEHSDSGDATGDDGDDYSYSQHAGSAADSDLVPADQRPSPLLTALSRSAPLDSWSGGQEPQVAANHSRREPHTASLLTSDDDDDGDGDERETLPDSRKVVQGLLRSIPPPKSQPPQSAIDRAKRNTVQLSVHGSAVDVSTRSPQGSPPARSGLSRSASAHGQIRPADSGSHSMGGDKPRAAGPVVQPSAVPSEPAVGFLGPNQLLGHSASTLRPSSDTFFQEGSGSDSAEDPQENTAVGGNYVEEPASPTGSSDTASTHHEGSEDAAVPAAGALTALSHSAAHRLLKDGTGPMLVRELDGSSGLPSQPSPLSDELPLDDWLVLLHGWSAMHDASADASSFYESFLKDMQSTLATGGPRQTDAYALLQRQMDELASADSETQSAIDDILGVSQGVGRRLDTLERELDDIARLLVQAN
ncbi:hypothetical protein LPJ61_001712 [Coemansia biformis]|uniref:SH3 domain-containing protein n=1 Tax=Coemansia biformis TaxID=1286918 RepID=A0A9W7Y9J8_9FUNG|nr:hypothetical protein LPJ61_001712 [Coemansia biformis]